MCRRRRKTAFIAGTLILAICISLSVQAQKLQRLKKDSPAGAKNDGGAAAVFKKFEKAWRASDTETISSLLGKRQISFNVGGIGVEGGYYSKAQVFYMMKKVFKNHKQLRFEFVMFHNLDKPGRKVYGIAYRSYKNIRSDKVFQDKVYVTLKKEGVGWVVVEITTTK